MNEGPDAPVSAQARWFGGRRYDFAGQVVVMAVVDVTPNSFHRPGSTYRYADAAAAIRRAEDEGADWLDIGGVAYGPGPEVSAKEELDRVLPAVAAVREHTDLAVSVDTFRAEVAARAIAGGAAVINDASGLREPELADVVAGTDVGLVITHAGDGPTMPSFRPTYDDVTAEVLRFLRDRVEFALSRGVRAEQLILDPGIDLHKNTYHSLELLRRMDEVVGLGHPVLTAISNKDFIGESLGGLPSEERLEGSLAGTVLSVERGARLVRAHDVRATVRAVRMTEVVLGMRRPGPVVHNVC